MPLIVNGAGDGRRQAGGADDAEDGNPLPSMDVLLSSPEAGRLTAAYGRESGQGGAPAGDGRRRIRPEALLGQAEAGPGEPVCAHPPPRLERHRRAAAHQPRAGAVLRRGRAGGPRRRPARATASVEFDAETGGRGKTAGPRSRAAARDLFGAEDAIAVNNNAAAVFLALAALARGRPVLVSRGELVAIGGSLQDPRDPRGLGGRAPARSARPTARPSTTIAAGSQRNRPSC